MTRTWNRIGLSVLLVVALCVGGSGAIAALCAQAIPDLDPSTIVIPTPPQLEAALKARAGLAAYVHERGASAVRTAPEALRVTPPVFYKDGWVRLGSFLVDIEAMSFIEEPLHEHRGGEFSETSEGWRVSFVRYDPLCAHR